MRLLLTIFVIATVLTSCDTTPKYSIKGTINNFEAKKVYLRKFENRIAIAIDSAEVVGGKFLINGSIDKTTACAIFPDDLKDPITPLFYVENVEFILNMDAKDRKANSITGGAASQKLSEKFYAIDMKMLENRRPVNDKIAALNKDKANMKQEEFEDAYNQLKEEHKFRTNIAEEKKMALVKANLSSVVSADVFANNLFLGMDIKDAEELAKSFTGDAAASESIIRVKEKIANIDKVEIGNPAPDFTLNTPEGKPLSLSSFKGKVLLVDFWASWCRPCRKENPHLVKIYKKFHEEGLEILSVSLDSDKVNWKKAIKKDGLIWNHVSDLKGWYNEAAQLYAITMVPHVVLIDKDGIIVAKDLRGVALEEKVAELIK